MQSETLAQEFARLVKEYHEGNDHTKPEAWNLLADYAVDNADAISAALSAEQTQPVAVKALEWAPIVEGGRDIEAKTEFGIYTISIDSSFAGGTHYLWTPDRREFDDDHHSEYRSRTAALTAAQSDYETRIRSALVDVPAEAVDKEIARVVQSVCEWDDRTSPDDYPEHLLITPDELSDILRNFSDVTRTSPPLSREGEDTAEAFARVVAARKAHIDATDTYNTRLALVNSERAKGNWSMKVDQEARAMWDAQSAFIRTAQDEADAALAATRSGSATEAKGSPE